MAEQGDQKAKAPPKCGGDFCPCVDHVTKRKAEAKKRSDEFWGGKPSG